MKKILYSLAVLGIVFMGCESKKDEAKITDEIVKNYEKGLNQNLEEFKQGFRQSSFKGDIKIEDFKCKAEGLTIICQSPSPKIIEKSNKELIFAKSVEVKTDFIYLGDKQGKIPVLEAYKHITKDGQKFLNVSVKDIELANDIKLLAAVAGANPDMKDYKYLLSFANDKFDFDFDIKTSNKNDDMYFDLDIRLINNNKNTNLSHFANSYTTKDFYDILDKYGQKYDTILNKITLDATTITSDLKALNYFKFLYVTNAKFLFTTNDIKSLEPIINKHKKDLINLATSEGEKKVIDNFVDALLKDGKINLEFINIKGLNMVDFLESFINNPSEHLLKTKLNGKEVELFI